jgi:putative PIN family toxin of toxin-antitoxin system
MPVFIPKIVIDTNIYISAIFWGGKPRVVVDLGRSEQVLIFTSSEIEKEIEKKLKTKFGLSNEEAAQILLDFSTFTVPVKVSRRITVIDDDPDDDKFIECAVASRSGFIVSGDKHLLNLKEYKGIKIMKAADFLSLFLKK